MGGLEGNCFCEPQAVTKECEECWALMRRNNTSLSWACFMHKGEVVTVVNLSSLLAAMLHCEWQAVKNMLYVIARRRPKIAWRRDWTAWMDIYR